MDGVTIGYDYNNVGWLTLVDRPPGWADAVVTYTGLGGAFHQIVTRGTERTTTSYDSTTRPTLVKREALSGGGTTTYTRTEYNARGMETFNSFPSTSSFPTNGVEKRTTRYYAPSSSGKTYGPWRRHPMTIWPATRPA